MVLAVATTPLNPTLRRILEENIVTTEAGERRPLHSAISMDEGLFVQDIIQQIKPRTSLEVGCAYGISSLFICQALQDVGAENHIIIDPYQIGSTHKGPDPGYEGIGLANIERAGFTKLVSFCPELSYRCLPRLEEAGTRLDFAFIDGMHTFDYALVDFFFIDKMLNVGGAVVFDDLSYPSIRKLCRFVLRNLQYSVIGPLAATSTGRRRIVEQLASISGLIGNLMRDDLSTPDSKMGLPSGRYVALRKTANDRIGDGETFNRRWDTHGAF